MSNYQPTIVHANDLTNASYNLSLQEQRLILLACSKIDSKAKDHQREFFIKVKEYEESFGLTKHKDNYGLLRRLTESLWTKDIILFCRDTNRKIKLRWLTRIEYEIADTGHGVYVRFSEDISPFLFHIKERFTCVSFEIASKLDTHFSFRLYQWLKEFEHQSKFKNEFDAVEITLDIDWMKEQAQIVGKYDKWNDFKKWVLVPAINKINQVTDLSVVYKFNKTNRFVTSVTFGFAFEKAIALKPIRPRLHRRPKVVKGSHEEGVWMRKNLAILLDYEKALKAYDKHAKMDLPDLRKMAEYASIFDSFLEERLKIEIRKRTNKIITT